MEKKSFMEEVKHLDILSILIGVSIVFSGVAAVLGYGSLSIGNAMVVAVFCVLACMSKDLKELCNDLVEKED